jgi:sarcosine oxidase, subunit alpha
LAILDRRPAGHSGPAPELPGIEVFRGVTALRARGRDRVREILFESAGRRHRIRCDVVGMSGGWQPADELLYAATSDGQAVVEGRRATEPVGSPADGRALPLLQGVGAVVGTADAEAALAEGRRVGAAAVEALRG